MRLGHEKKGFGLLDPHNRSKSDAGACMMALSSETTT